MFRIATTIAAIGIVGSMATTVQADSLRSDATDFSSQNKPNKNKPAVTTTRTTTTVVRQQTVKPSGGSNKFSGGGNKARFQNNAVTVKQKTTVTTTNNNFKGNNFKANNNFKSNNNAGKFNAGTNPNFKTNTSQTFKFTPGPGQASKVSFKPASNIKFVKLGKFSAPVWKSGPKKVWYGNKWKVFVPLTALGVVALGGAYYYPDAYLTTSRNYCEGFSEDGCRLNWQRVDFEDGESDWQCVQYCRRPDAPPPPRTVAFVAPPPPAQGAACEIAIFSEPNFSGTNATASEEQPHLSDNGWQNQIASVQVKAGTWDFFSDQEFTGETMRLPPGDYADLGPQWSKKAGSFMCVQP
jgi:hypothetical protein